MHDLFYFLFFFSFLFLSARCDVEDGWHQLRSSAGQPHTRLVVHINHVYTCQLTSGVTPLNLEQITPGENLTLELPKIPFHPFQLVNQLGECGTNVAFSAFQRDISGSIIWDVLRGWRYAV